MKESTEDEARDSYTEDTVEDSVGPGPDRDRAQYSSKRPCEAEGARGRPWLVCTCTLEECSVLYHPPLHTAGTTWQDHTHATLCGQSMRPDCGRAISRQAGWLPFQPSLHQRSHMRHHVHPSLRSNRAPRRFQLGDEGIKLPLECRSTRWPLCGSE